MYRSRHAILVLLCWLIVAEGDGDFVRNEDICGPHNGRRVYLELGEKGVLYAKNVTFTKNEPRQSQQPKSQPQQQEISQIYTSNSSHNQCSLELVTCPSCVIIVTFRNLALSHHCGDGGVTMDSPCRCDYVWISEPPYEDVSGTPFCGLYAPITYRSSTRTLSLTLLYSQSHKEAFTLEYTAERNRLHLRGTELMTGGAKGLNSTGGGILTSPFFPARYPRDLGLEYIVTCPSEAPSCRIRLLFSDFQLAPVSIMEFYDWNGQRLDVSSGARFRPPVIMSSGPSLLIRFYANGGTGLGYKAFYSFVIGHLFDKSVQPITDCGGYVENLGGAITMMDMVGEGVKTYDCVWLIRPPKTFLHMKTHLYLKVVTFADMAGNTELVIKQGPTSALLPLEILRHPARQIQPPRHREHVAPVTSGFHVSLRGTFGSSSHLAIAYAAFSYIDCFAGSDFLCQNHRCIPSQLHCDGFDHCGDNSDEPATCFQDWELEPQDRKWHTNKANYYFPKIDRYPDLKTATLVFVASSLGLIVLISALIILLYRVGARARQQRELQSRLQTISELLDGARIDEISVSDDPPVYEPPPGYDEVVKLSLETENLRGGKKKRRSFGREPRSRSSPSRCSLNHAQSSTYLVSESASTSRSSQTTPVPGSSDGNRSQRLPESPPPPYVTPPGTMPRNFNVPGGPPSSATCNESEIPEALEGGEGEFSGFSAEQSEFEGQLASVPIDADVLGAYLRDSSTTSTICTADASSDSQPRNSSDVSIVIEPEFDPGEVTPGRTVAEDGAEDGQVRVDVVDDSSPGCSCEGACGCANDRRSPRNLSENAIIEKPGFSGFSIASSDADFPADAAFISIADRREMLESKRNQKEEREEEDLSRSMKTIVKLLAGKWQSGMATSGSSPSANTSGLFRRPSKRSCSRDGYLATVGSLGSSSDDSGGADEPCKGYGTDSSSGHASYEKLENEIEPQKIDPDADTASRTDRRSRSYSSCDLKSLYESIQILDGYLARRDLPRVHGRKQSVAVMLFGTPEHRGAGWHGSDVEETRRSRKRLWRSSADTLSN